VSAARLAAALAVLALALPVRAYRRSCDRDTGKCFYWDSTSVTWRVNASRPSTSPSCQGSPAMDAVLASFAAWEGATHPGDGEPCMALALPFGGATSSIAIGLGTSAEHIVVFRQGWCSANPSATADASCYPTNSCANKYNCFDDAGGIDRGILALTTVIYTPSTGRIVDADTEIADWGGAADALTIPPADGWYYTCAPDPQPAQCGSYGQPDCSYMDLQNTMTHEAGHFVGLAHPCEQGGTGGAPVCTAAMASTTMYPQASPRQTTKRTLDPDDVNGVCAIYPRFTSGPAGGAFGAAPQMTAGRSGCGAGGGGPIALLLAALALVPRLRRRRAAGRGAGQDTVTPA